MQIARKKKVWLFLMLGMAILTVFCFLTSGKKEKRTYVNGKMVEHQQQGEKTMEICWGER